MPGRILELARLSLYSDPQASRGGFADARTFLCRNLRACWQFRPQFPVELNVWTMACDSLE